MGADRELLETFLDEARDYLARIRRDLAPALQGRPLPPEHLEPLLATVHNLKGVSGLLGFTHLHALVKHLESTFSALSSDAGPGIAPELAGAALGALERMIAHIAEGRAEENEEVLLDFELGAEIYTSLSARLAETHPAPHPEQGLAGMPADSVAGTPADSIAGMPADAVDPLAEALAIETAEKVEAINAWLLPALDETLPAPRQRAAAGAEREVRQVLQAATMAGRPDVAEIASGLAEHLADLVRGRRPADDDHLDLALRLTIRLGRLAAGSGFSFAEAKALLDESARLMAALEADDPAGAPHSDRDEAQAELEAIFVEEAEEHLESARASVTVLEAEPADPDALGRLFRAIHTLKGAAGTVGAKDAAAIAHTLEDILAAARDGARPVESGLLREARSGIARLADAIAPLGGDGSGAPADEASDPPKMADGDRLPTGSEAAGSSARIRVRLDRLDRLQLEAAELSASRLRASEASGRLRYLVRMVNRRRAELSGRVDAFVTDHAYTLPPMPVAAAGTPTAPSVIPFPPVSLEFDSYDEVNVLARELSDLDFQLQEAIGGLCRLAEGLVAEMEGMGTLAARLQDDVTAMRFVPIAGLLERYRAPALEWAAEAGRKVTVAVEAGDVQVDRTVAEAMAAPVVQLVRNAVAHGIETPDARRAAGKDETGRIVLRALQDGADVVIEVADDGRGLDPEALRAAAVARGLLDEAQARAMPDARLPDLMFLPGFSTRAEADALAGRGVGLDVVASTVARLGGVVSVASEPGGGTRFSARMPPSASVLPVLSMRCGAADFALPLPAVRETLLVDRQEAARALDGGRRLQWHGQELRVVSLSAATGAGRPVDLEGRRIPAVIIGHGGRNAALLVDGLLGQEEGMLRPLGALLDPMSLYAGAIVSPDGKVRLVLDASYLLAAAFGMRPMARTPAVRAGDRLPRVLLVDDSRSVRIQVGRLLRTGGFEVVAAPDGAAALERLRAEPFDLVLTDLEMPRLHGYELLEQMRADPRLAGIPTVVLSSRSGPKHVARAEALGARDFLSKPVKRETLVSRIRACLDGGD
jgi:chemosensory pili system protein ChpA (sensor histidine kinase/response regulator)